MTTTTTTTSPGIGFFGLLTILFIGLKFTGYITWSWWWVLSPIPIAIAVGVFLAAIGFVIYAAYRYITD